MRGKAVINKKATKPHEPYQQYLGGKNYILSKTDKQLQGQKFRRNSQVHVSNEADLLQKKELR